MRNVKQTDKHYHCWSSNIMCPEGSQIQLISFLFSAIRKMLIVVVEKQVEVFKILKEEAMLLLSQNVNLMDAMIS